MTEHLCTNDNSDFENLLLLGFSETEAPQLIYMKNHFAEEIEFREMIEESRRFKFIRWLIEHNRLSE